MARKHVVRVVGTFLLALTLGQNQSAALRAALPACIRDAPIEMVADWLREASEALEKSSDKKDELLEWLEQMETEALRAGVPLIDD